MKVNVKVDGRLVKTHVQQENGTLEQMEETIHAIQQAGGWGCSSAQRCGGVWSAPPISEAGGERRHGATRSER